MATLDTTERTRRDPVELIILARYADGWRAAMYRGDRPDPRIVNAFGTNVLPLPFTADAEQADVAAEIQRLHPDARVRVAAGLYQ